MSNVLIGIIGVILFIGLALAGALILGDDFRAANSSSKAAAYVSQTQQIARAVAMYELKLGKPIETTNNVSVLVPRFLKVAPQGAKINRWSAYFGAAYITLPDTQENRDICTEIQRTSGQIGMNEPFNSAPGAMSEFARVYQTGCRIHTADTGNLTIWTTL